MTKRNGFNFPFIFFLKKEENYKKEVCRIVAVAVACSVDNVCGETKRNETKRNEALDGAMGLIET